jgi:hypothetical protein
MRCTFRTVAAAFAAILAATPLQAEVTGALKTAVIVFSTPSRPQWPTPTADYVNERVFSEDPLSLNGYIKENSNGTASVIGTVFGPYHFGPDMDCHRMNNLFDYINAIRAHVGSQIEQYEYVIYLNPCSTNGLVAGFAFGRSAWMGSLGGVMKHEFGHQMGLPHAHALQCAIKKNAKKKKLTPVPITDTALNDPNCYRIDYGDPYSTMGWGGGVLNGYERQVLGWMNYLGTPLVQTVQFSGRYTITPLTKADDSVKALEIAYPNASSSNQAVLFIEFRQPVGREADNLPPPKTLDSGVFVRLGDWVHGYLLNMKAGKEAVNAGSLKKGQLYKLPHGVSLQLCSVTPLTSATIAIGLNGDTPDCR